MAKAKKKILKKKSENKKLKLSIPTIVVLAVLGIINASIAISYFLMMAIGTKTILFALFAINQTGYAWFFYAGIVLSIVNAGLMFLIYQRRKWAFFAYIASVVITFSIDLFVGVDINSLLGLGGPVLLYFFLRKDWKVLK